VFGKTRFEFRAGLWLS